MENVDPQPMDVVEPTKPPPAPPAETAAAPESAEAPKEPEAAKEPEAPAKAEPKAETDAMEVAEPSLTSAQPQASEMADPASSPKLGQRVLDMD